ncbi:MAG: TonB-dependent receptor plug domain-containing protein, partial [Rikenellaceae bacterium]|nr:TonB-dependent receptor plug domain-containing protein [Rikenellaceae bacterium]
KGLSSDEAQTVMKVLNQIKRENSPRVEMPEIICRGRQTQYPRVELVDVKVESVSIAEEPLYILNGKEISAEEFKGLDPNSIADIKIIKGEEAVSKYGEKAANGVFLITAKKDFKQQKIDNEDVVIIYHGKVISKEEAEKMGISVNVIVKEIKDNQQQIRQRIAEMQQCRAAQQQAQGPIQGFMGIRAGRIDTKNIDSKEEAVQLIDNGKVLIILDGIEISEEKFKSLDPNSIERLELIKGETMKVLYGEKAADGVLMITSTKVGSENAQRVSRRANAKNVHRVTKADLKPIDSATKLNAISIYEPKLHVRGSMARIENINSDELPVISKFKQNGNQVSFRIEIPKSETTKKQKFDIQYTLPTEM